MYGKPCQPAVRAKGISISPRFRHKIWYYADYQKIISHNGAAFCWISTDIYQRAHLYSANIFRNWFLKICSETGRNGNNCINFVPYMNQLLLLRNRPYLQERSTALAQIRASGTSIKISTATHCIRSVYWLIQSQYCEQPHTATASLARITASLAKILH